MAFSCVMIQTLYKSKFKHIVCLQSIFFIVYIQSGINAVSKPVHLYFCKERSYPVLECLQGLGFV